MSGYRNPEFDKLAATQKLTVNVEARRQMIFDMQEMLLEDVPYYPLYNPHIIEATVNKRFKGWVERVDGIGNIWSLCMVKPVD
jgi:ABC-type transport system substrate-binding protein